jgi:hypothetical protein
MGVTMVAHAKEKIYHNQHLPNAFLPLAIKVFVCLHQQVDNFFHWCASMVWLAKGIDGYCLADLSVFYK